MGGASSLVLTRYRVTVEALERLALPAYLGSTVRGAFDHAFRTLCCPARPGEPCPVPSSCPYHLVFETAPPPDATALRTHEEIPRPFVLAAPPAGPRDYPPGSDVVPPGSDVVFDLTLVGRARDFFPHFVVTLREVDRLGRGRRAVRLRRINAVHPLDGTEEPAHRVEESLVRPTTAAVSLADCGSTPRSSGPSRRAITSGRPCAWEKRADSAGAWAVSWVKEPTVITIEERHTGAAKRASKETTDVEG
jgi:hypothetical protein